MTDDFEIELLAERNDGAELRVGVPRDLRFFEGHFEGDPILPGIAQLIGLVDRQARARFGSLGEAARIARLKFESIVRPGETLSLLLERSAHEAGTQVRFRILRGDVACASGAVIYSLAREPALEPAAPRDAAIEYPALTTFVPHRPPMLVLDALVESTDSSVRATRAIRAGDVFVEEGGVSSLLALELFAQTAAAHFGYLASVRGAGMASGALLGARKIELAVGRLDVGDELEVRASQVMSMPPAAQYECVLVRARAGRSEIVARGAINVAMGGPRT